LASALWFFAASEQEYFPAETQDPNELDERVQHAKQAETLLPAFAVASVFAVAVVYGGDLSQEVLPYLASTLCVLVVSLGIRNWWAQRVEARLNQKLRDQAIDLIKAKETAEASDIAKSRFLSWVSHETRTPLSGVLGFSELLENRH
jgi:signal transduction histidine kinase